MQYLKFINYRADEINFTVSKELTPGEKNFKIVPNVRVDIKIEGKNYFTTMTITIASKEETPTPFDINLKIWGQFLITAPTDINTFRYESTSFLYPYARSIITNLVSMANMPPYFLPVIDFRFSDKAADGNGEKRDTITIRPLTDEV